jgi:NADPH-dependent curcumin reductase CurA
VRHGTWALEEIHAAFREMLARHNIGKIVVRVAP